MAWLRLGEPNLLTLGGRRATMAVVAGEAAQLELNVNICSLRGSSGYKKQPYGFLVSSSSSLTAQLLVGGGESSSRDDVLLALQLGFVGKIRRARATIYKAFVSYPVPRNRERSLHMCAQDVQIARMATI
jgi:hypothetical protein